VNCFCNWQHHLYVEPEIQDDPQWYIFTAIVEGRASSLHLADLAAKVPEAVGRHQSASCTLPAEAGDFEGSCAIAGRSCGTPRPRTCSPDYVSLGLFVFLAALQL
jgi:hypothetical protein